MSQSSTASLTTIDAPASFSEEDFSHQLAAITPFEDLSAGALKALCENASQRRYAAGQTVYAIGQYDGGEALIVTSGRLHISIATANTAALSVEELSANKIFGLEFAFCERDSEVFESLAVTAKDDLSVIAVDSASLREIAAQKPSLMRNLARYFANALCDMQFSNNVPETPPEQRIFAALLEFVERNAMTGDWEISRMPKHRELAEMAGVNETIAAGAVASLIQDDIARRHYPGLIINDMARLNALAS